MSTRFTTLFPSGGMNTKRCVMVEASMHVLEDGDGFCEVHVNTPGGILVSLALLVASPSRYLSRKATLVLGLFRVCPQCQKARKSFAKCLVGDPFLLGVVMK